MKGHAAGWVVALGLLALTPARAEHPRLDWLTYTGAGSCASPCHINGDWTMEEMARGFAGSAHFQWKADLPANTVFEPSGAALQGSFGALNRLDGLNGTLAPLDWLSLDSRGEATGCARCHAGTGTLTPDQLVADSWRSVDCLICHSSVYQVDGQPLTDAMARPLVADAQSPTGVAFRFPSGADLGATTASITLTPPAEACQRCHGGMDSQRMRRSTHTFSQDDRHARNLTCVDCHQATAHALAGRPRVGQWAVDNPAAGAAQLVTCAGCHSSAGQAARPDLAIPIPAHEGIPGAHFSRLACEACHIPASDGLSQVDFSRLERVVEAGRFVRWQPATVAVEEEQPVYRWSNGTLFSTDEPRGFFQQFGNRVTPFHELVSRVPVDAGSGRQLPLDMALLGRADSLMTNVVAQPQDTTSLLELAVRGGVERAAAADATWAALLDNGHYTRAWRWEERSRQFAVGHGVVRANDILHCGACHGHSERIRWSELGYADDPYISSVGEGGGPLDFELGPCRPNPFNNTTLVPFQLSRPARVDLSVHDLRGRLVLQVLRDSPMAAGAHEVPVAADRLPSGAYLYRLRADGRECSGKFLLVK